MHYYYDTCAIVKAFHQEVGSDQVRKLLTDVSATYVSTLTYAEFYSTIYKKLRQKEIRSESIAIQVCRTFEMSMQYFNLVQTDENIFTQAKNLIARFGSKYDLRNYHQ